MSVRAFYDELAPLYHLIYENWEASVARQGAALASLIANIGEPTRERCTTRRLESARKRSDSSRWDFG
jgi:hypothetical protein